MKLASPNKKHLLKKNVLKKNVDNHQNLYYQVYIKLTNFVLVHALI